MFRRLPVQSAVSAVLYVYGGHRNVAGCSSSSSAEGKEGSNDFVVLGLGVAGNKALDTLVTELERRGIANKRIVVIDSDIGERRELRRSGSLITLIGGTVRGIDTKERAVLLDSNTKVKFSKLLISTGQSSLDARSLRDIVAVGVDAGSLLSAASPAARSALLARARRREHATFVGANSWAQLQLLHDVQQESRQSGCSGSVTLLYPGFGVLSNILPRHLSIAVTRRLQTMGVELLPYHQLQYVSSGGERALELHTTASYDSLSTSRLLTHALVLPPQGLFSTGRHFTERAGLEVHPEGGLLLNPNLQSRCGIFGAGDIASVLTSSGRYVFAGTAHARRSGEVAAINMLRSSLGEQSVEYDTVPSSSYALERWGLNFTLAGTCSSALDMYTFQWKASSSSSSSKKSAAGRSFSGSDSPRGLRRLARLSAAARDAALPNPLGVSVTFYSDGGVVIGVMVVGVPESSAVAQLLTRCIGIDIRHLPASDIASDAITREGEEEGELEESTVLPGGLVTVERMAAMATRIIAPAAVLLDGRGLPRPTFFFSHPSRVNLSRNNENEKIFTTSNTGSVKGNLAMAYKTGASRASIYR